MNALYLNHAESDFGGAQLWNGLNHVIGNGNVYDFPEKLSYHGEVDRYNLAEAQGREGHEDGNTAPLPWMPNRPSFTFGWDDAVVRARLANGFFQLCVIESCRHTAVATFLRLAEDIRKAEIPIVLHDGEDFHQMQWDIIRKVKPHLILKREMLKSEWPDAIYGMIQMPHLTGPDCEPRLLAFPFSCPDEIIPTEAEFLEARRNLKYDVCCLMGESWPGRADVLRALESLPPAVRKCLGSSAPPERPLFEDGAAHPLLAFDEYIQALRHSRCGVSVRGFGIDTCRYWETAANTLLIAREPDIHIPYPYKNRDTCMSPDHFYDDEAEVAGHMSGYHKWLEHAGEYSEEEVDALALACHRWTREHHTNSARVKYMLSHLSL